MMTRFIIKALFLCSLMFSVAAFSQTRILTNRNSADLEKRVDFILQKITQNQFKEAEEETNRLIKDYPDFRLGQLIKGDLTMMRTRQIAPFSGNGRYSEREKEGLRTEAIARLQASKDKIPENYLPLNFLKISTSIPYIIAVDTGKSRLYLIEQKPNGDTKIVLNYYMSIGKGGDSKQREGDNKTPVGIYNVISYIPKEKLPDYYGAGAFPLNYPNAWDKRNKRDGYGIWIHGSPSSTWSRPPLASEGCVVLPNADFSTLKPYVNVGKTPVLIASRIDWVPKDQLVKQREQFMNALDQWRLDFQSLNMDKYLSHYSSNFNTNGQNYASWSVSKRKINASKTWITLNLENITLLQDPGKEGVMFVSFDQDYKSSNLSNQMRKTQYWVLENGQWKIIYEGSAQ